MIKKTTIYWIAGICGAFVVLVLISALIGLSTSQNNGYSTSFSDTAGLSSGSFAPPMAGIAEMVMDSSVKRSAEPGIDYGSVVEPVDQNIIKTGNITMQVDNIDESVGQLQTIAQSYGGDVITQSINAYNDEKRGYVTLRVEEKNFEVAFEAVKELGTQIILEDISTEDVTEQVIDLEARLSNARLEEESYLNVLNKAQTVEDILKVQNYLSTVREKIERFEAQLEFYTNRTSYSHISVNLTEEVSVTFDREEFRPWQDVKNAAQSVIELFQGIVIAVIYLTIVGGAIIIPILIVFFSIRAIIRKVKTKKK
ncbi:MAG: DUF4349 domain-containing protein [Patescibacteria group bacterium]